MLRKSFSVLNKRTFSASAAQASKVAILGAAGGIGQPLSLLLKSSKNITELALFDIVNTPGVAADISHISTRAKVTSGTGNDELASVLTGADVVVVPAGVPRKPGMTRDELFSTNASIVYTLAAAAAKHCPKAHMLIIANPVNSTVPIVAEAFKKAGVYDPKRLFGVTTLDVTRAKTFIAEAKAAGSDPSDLNVTVIGGHAGKTILPLLSSTDYSFSEAERDALTHRIQFGGDEVVQAKAGAGSATLSMAYAGAHFTERLLAALSGEAGVVECTFVDQGEGAEVEFFAYPTQLGKNGVEKIHKDVQLNDFEQAAYKELVPELQGSIKKGKEFAASQ